MAAILILLGLAVIIFAVPVLFGAPYLPTLKSQIDTALDLSQLQPGQTLLELGCGDGKVLQAAASRGIKAIGIELNPILVIAAKVKTRKQRKLIKIIWGNYWWVTWPKTEVIYTFLIGKYMNKLDNKIAQYPQKPVKLISIAFKVPNRKINAHQNGVYLYNYQ